MWSSRFIEISRFEADSEICLRQTTEDSISRSVDMADCEPDFVMRKWLYLDENGELQPVTIGKQERFSKGVEQPFRLRTAPPLSLAESVWAKWSIRIINQQESDMTENKQESAIQTADPLVAGRMAKCTCGRTEPSSPKLAFFEFCGEGSRDAVDICGCGYHSVAHTPEVMARNPALKCSTFKASGPREFDRYYCGCRGWD